MKASQYTRRNQFLAQQALLHKPEPTTWNPEVEAGIVEYSPEKSIPATTRLQQNQEEMRLRNTPQTPVKPMSRRSGRPKGSLDKGERKGYTWSENWNSQKGDAYFASQMLSKADYEEMWRDRRNTGISCGYAAMTGGRKKAGQ